MIKNIENLSKTQKKILYYIISYQEQFKYSPTRREIVDYFSIARTRKYSRQWAEYHLQELERIGIIKRGKPTFRRNIEIVFCDKKDKEILQKETLS